MIRILHTGDLHFGKKYDKYPNNISSRYKSARFEALENIIITADREKCDYIVIAGDTFDNKSVPPALRKYVCDALAKSSCTVIVIPGNHDYCAEENDEFWDGFEKLSGENTILLRKHEVYNGSDGKTVFFPCGCKDRYSAENALGWLANAPKSPDKVNIGIAHGAIETLSYDREGKYYGMTISELKQTGLDLWLIGHTHIPYPNEDVITSGNIFNAGTHQQTDISDNSEGSVFIIDIDDNKNISARKVLTGAVHFVRKSIKLSHGDSLRAALENALSGDCRNTSYRIELSGIISEDDYTEKQSIYDEFRSRTISLEISDNALCPEITKERIEKETLDNSLENTLLKQYLDQNETELLNLAFNLICECKGGAK